MEAGLRAAMSKTKQLGDQLAQYGLATVVPPLFYPSVLDFS